MAIYGKSQGYYFYARPTSVADFTVGEAVVLRYANGDRVSTAISQYLLTAVEDVPSSGSLRKYWFVGIRPQGETSSTVAPPLSSAPRFSTDMYLVGESSGAAAALRGPWFAGKIVSEEQAAVGTVVIAIGEGDYNPFTDDLFDYTDEFQTTVVSDGNPFSTGFMLGTPFTAEEMDYTCIPVRNRMEFPVPYIGAYGHRHGAVLVTPWHAVTSDQSPWDGGSATQMSFYDPETEALVSRSIASQHSMTSWADIFEAQGVAWLRDSSGVTNSEKQMWAVETIRRVYASYRPDENLASLDTLIRDTRIVVLSTPAPNGVKPADLPLMTGVPRSKLGYGIMIDQNGRGYPQILSDALYETVITTESGSSVETIGWQVDVPSWLDRGKFALEGAVGDQGSPFLTRFGTYTLFLGHAFSVSTEPMRPISVVNGIPQGSTETETRSRGCTLGLGGTLARCANMVIPDDVSLDEVPNPWKQDPDLVANPSNYPQFIRDLVDANFLPSVPSSFRNMLNLFSARMNALSRASVGSSYPPADVEFSFVDVEDDCPWVPCLDWQYRKVVSRNETVLNADRYPFYRAPRERASLGSIVQSVSVRESERYDPLPSATDVSEADIRSYLVHYPLTTPGANPSWNGWVNRIIAMYMGTNLDGPRAFAWEPLPANPKRSSPWHNIIYEQVIDSYKAGVRAFFINFPINSLDRADGLEYEHMVNERNDPSDPSGLNAPARWMGFFDALYDLATGKMVPTGAGRDPITEPCDIHVQMTSITVALARGFSLAKYSQLGPTQWNARIDSYANRWIDLCAKVGNVSRVTMGVDALVAAKTPTTVDPNLSDLQRTYELSDWRLASRMKAGGVDVFVEARPLTNTEWSQYSSLQEEYNLFAQAKYVGHVPDRSLKDVLRGPLNTFPMIPSDDPYQTLTTVREVQVLPPATGRIYTPHFALFSLYSLSDHYRHRERILGAKFKRPGRAFFWPELFLGGSGVVAAENDSSTTVYRRFPNWILLPTPIYNEADWNAAYQAWVANGSIGSFDYLGGLWTQEAKTFWNTNVRQNTLHELIGLLSAYSRIAGPPDEPLPEKYPDDYISSQVVPSQLREPPPAGGGEEPNPDLSLPFGASLTYEVWATTWNPNPTIPIPDASPTLGAFVPTVNISEIFAQFRNPNDPSLVPQMDKVLSDLSKVPAGRRVVLPFFWQDDAASAHAIKHTFYKPTEDGVDYSGQGVTARFLSPWQLVNAEDGRASFKQFLEAFSASGGMFDYISDDFENYGSYGLGSVFNAGGNLASFYEQPDARRTTAIVFDPRFTTFVTRTTEKTFKDEFVQNYGSFVPGATTNHETILAPFTDVTSATDFRAPWNIGQQPVMWAWQGALYSLQMGDIYLRRIVDPLRELPQFSNVRIHNYGVYAKLEEDVISDRDANTHLSHHAFIPDLNFAPVLYGEVSEALVNLGYNPLLSAGDPLRKRWGGGTTVGGGSSAARSHVAFIKDIQTMRVAVRGIAGREDIEIAPWVSSWNLSESSYFRDIRYWDEMVYHCCLSGVRFFNLFLNPYTQFGSVHARLQQRLDEWKTVSGNSRALIVDSSLIDIVSAATNCVVTGGRMLTGSKEGTYVWRLTVPTDLVDSNGVTYLNKTGTRTDIPDLIVVGSGTRGAWLFTNDPQVPTYTASSSPAS
jgi:hypothetical protein